MKVITICGSSRFKEDIDRINRGLTLLGYVVFSLGVFPHAGDIVTEEQKILLDNIHRQKIDLSDEIYVVNKDGYIGNSTRNEIEYAKKMGKKINYVYDYNTVMQ